MKCKTCGHEIENKTIKVDGVEYETETHDFNKKLSDIEIPKGWRLWTSEECIKLNNKVKLRKQLNLEDCWFFIEQPFLFNNKLVAWFSANSDRAYLNCSGGPAYTYSSLGVRFCRSVKK